jgi:DNA-binding response OmpR family regulator
MHDPHPQPGIRGPIRLNPALAGGQDQGDAGELDEQAGEQPQARKRVMLVEDEFLLSAVLSADLQDFGYDVLGPYPTLSRGMEAVESESFDGAILDINLKGEMVYPLAEELLRRGIPFLFLSGYEAANMPAAFRGHARLAKPANPAVLLRAVRNMFAA